MPRTVLPTVHPLRYVLYAEGTVFRRPQHRIDIVSQHPMSFGARGLDGSVIRGRGTHRRGRGVATRGALQGVR